jgi:hypothetical protein
MIVLGLRLGTLLGTPRDILPSLPVSTGGWDAITPSLLRSIATATVAEAATTRSMGNPVGREIHQKNDRVKKLEDVRELRGWMSIAS